MTLAGRVGDFFFLLFDLTLLCRVEKFIIQPNLGVVNTRSILYKNWIFIKCLSIFFFQ